MKAPYEPCVGLRFRLLMFLDREGGGGVTPASDPGIFLEPLLQLWQTLNPKP